MAITLDKTITRNSGNIINTDTNYSELNVKANGLVEDIVDHIETELTSAETQLNATVTTKVNEFDARINQIASIDDSTYNTDAIDTKATAMSKAAFEAIARDNRDKFAGSGFVEWGYSRNGGIYGQVNSGITAVSSLSNKFLIGGDSYATDKVSKTAYPISNVNGVVHKLSSIGESATGIYSQILLPEAPKVTHADASNSGMVKNGRNMVDTSGWLFAGAGGGVSVVNNKLRIDNASWGYVHQVFTTVAGVEYTIEFDADLITSTQIIAQISDMYYGNPAYASLTTTKSGRGVFKFTAVSNTTAFNIGGNVGIIDVNSIFMCPSSELSRSDLVFLESWHEDTSEKGVLYDLGNVQYKGTRTVGSAGSFVGSDTYSLFGNWQQAGALVGNSISIASLTFAKLQEFVGNPENNCYYDGDKLIQVRYRVRVVQGLGDSWYYTNVQENQYLAYDRARRFVVSAKGKNTSIVDETGYYAAVNYIYTSSTTNENGIYQMNTGSSSYSHNLQVYALPIALVHRRNQGATHVKFNPNGTKAFLNKDGLTPAHWYNTDQQITCIADCFDV